MQVQNGDQVVDWDVWGRDDETAYPQDPEIQKQYDEAGAAVSAAMSQRKYVEARSLDWHHKAKFRFAYKQDTFSLTSIEKE